MRAVCNASISPLASIAASVCVGPIGWTRMLGGRSSLIFSARRAPPRRRANRSRCRPARRSASDRMPRIHTGAVIWYSGAPMRLPIRSFGSRMPGAGVDVDAEWRKKRDGKTGMATNGRGSRNIDTVYDDSDISATSNSRWRNIRKNVSSTGRSGSEVDPVGPHGSVHQRARAIVIPAGHRQSELRHVGLLPGYAGSRSIAASAIRLSESR